MTAPDPRLDEIQARLSASTPGQWAVDELGDVATVPEFDLHRFDIMPETIARIELRKEDATFIANAPADVSFLLAELRKAHEALARVEALCSQTEKGRPQETDRPEDWMLDPEEVRDVIAAVAAAKGDERG